MRRQRALGAQTNPLVAGARTQAEAEHAAAIAVEPRDFEEGHGGALGGAPGPKAKNRMELGCMRFRWSFDRIWLGYERYAFSSRCLVISGTNWNFQW